MMDGDGLPLIGFERAACVDQTDRGLVARLDGERLRIDLIRDDVVRVKISRGGVFDEQPTFAVWSDPVAQDVAFELDRADAVVRLRTSALVVSLWLDPFRLDVHRSDGSAVVETARDAAGVYWSYATLNDAFTIRRRCGAGDSVYGLGEKSGRHNRRGRSFTLWNTDVLNTVTTSEFTAGRAPEDPRGDCTSTEFDPYYVSIPFFYHQDQRGRMAASFLDNGYRATYDFTGPAQYAIHFEGGQYTEYIFAGPGMADILSAYTWLTGRMALPPLWSLGYHQSRWHPYTQDDLEALARRHREHAIPCDALWLDIEYMDGYRVFTWDTKRFPDPAGMLTRLARDGFRAIAIIDPGVKVEPGYQVFDQAIERDLLCRTESGDVYVGQVWPGNTAFPDFATAEGRAWWGELNAAHVKSGLAGIWIDMNEPATGDIPPGRMRFDHGRCSHQRYHNQYALLMAIGTTAGLRSAMPELRTFILSRAGFAGIQRYAANWMGDNQSRWDHLWLSIPMAMGLGVSGQAFVGADVGGFAGHCNAELFLRWLQCGVLTPFCRNHSHIGNIDQYVWAWGDAVLSIGREAIELRYKLLPYIYAAFLRATETGAPVQRPLVFDHQYDPAVRDIDDEYLFGPDLLVAPVLAAGQTARQVYLPAGDWYDWHTDELLGGPRYVLAATPMDRIPLYARGGAVIPMWPAAPPCTAGHHPSALELHAFVPGRDGAHESMLQEDDGLTTAALRGARVRTTFTLTRRGSTVALNARVDGDGFPELAREAFHLVIHGARPAVVLLDGKRLEAGDRGFVIPIAAQNFTAEFEASAQS
ncbi:MAG: TIM-barrel domain-containing protein [Solirubrobacteraceae bacterium]